MKKITSIVLMITLTLSLVFTGCTKKDEKGGESSPTKTDSSKMDTTKEEQSNLNKEGFPIVKNKVTLTAIGITNESDISPDDAILYKELEEKTNVHIEWTLMTEDAWKEKKGILFANNDMPDILVSNKIVTDQDILNYGSQGLIIPINDLYEKYGYYLKEVFNEHPDLKKMITAADGNMYSFPQFGRGFPLTTQEPLYINKDWLDAVGMDVPTTTDELYQVLKAFKEQDPNGNGKADEIPYSFQKGSNKIDLFGSFGIVEDDKKTHLAVRDGKVIYSYATPEYKKGVEFFHKFFAEGLIDEEAYTQDGSMLKAKTKGSERVVGMFQSWRSTGWRRSDEDNDYVAIAPLAGPDGTRLWPLMQPGGSRQVAVITSNCEQPEVAMRWIDALYEPEWSVQVSLQYYLGEHMVKEGDKYKIVRKPDRDNAEDKKYFSNTRIFNVRKSTGERFIDKPAHIIEKQELDKLYNKFYPAEYYPSMAFLSEEESRELSEIAVDINNYAEEMHAKWMIAGGIEEEWDDYLAKLKDMKFERYLEIYQTAYDRYLNN